MTLHRSMTALALAVLLTAPAQVTAQRARCDRAATTSFLFGLTGGNIMPSGTAVSAKGTVRHRTTGQLGPVLGHVPRGQVRELARHAWRDGFGALPTAPTHPTGNPDIARQFIELHSACGSHHVEFAMGEEPALFREIYGKLTEWTAPMVQTRK